jgi:hypothetical protein
MALEARGLGKKACKSGQAEDTYESRKKQFIYAMKQQFQWQIPVTRPLR